MDTEAKIQLLHTREATLRNMDRQRFQQGWLKVDHSPDATHKNLELYYAYKLNSWKGWHQLQSAAHWSLVPEKHDYYPDAYVYHVGKWKQQVIVPKIIANMPHIMLWDQDPNNRANARDAEPPIYGGTKTDKWFLWMRRVKYSGGYYYASEQATLANFMAYGLMIPPFFELWADRYDENLKLYKLPIIPCLPQKPGEFGLNNLSAHI